MKKSFYLFLVLWCCTLCVQGQGTDLKKAFLEKAERYNVSVKEAEKAKDYRRLEQLYVECLRDYESLPDSVQKEIPASLGNLYYNLACYRSVQKKRKAAVKSFVKAFKLGYSNYGHVMKDTDLDHIRSDKEFQKTLAAMREDSDYLRILQQSGEYRPNGRQDTLPRFTYMNPNDSNLVRVRRYFKLDSVAGAGDEISKIKNILTYIHNLIRHDGNNANPRPMNAIALAEACKDGSRGLNCRGLATVLNECYLAMGWKSRFVTCMPKKYISDCHVINAVFSTTLDKWIWMDPTENAWVTDEEGNLLGISEVRERLRSGRPLLLNREANWNNRRQTTKENYLDNYMAKNLYYVECPLRSEFGTEAKPYDRKNYVNLLPTGYASEEANGHIVYDDEWFWQSPYRD